MENYFAFYEIPESFKPDAAIVKKKFYELSRLHHPDRAAQAGDDAVATALQMMAMNNKAYNIFKDSDATMQYLLQLNGVLEAEEKYNLPSSFLMEMMELNEAISEFEMEATEEKKQAAISNLQQQFEEWNTGVAPIIAKYEANKDSDLLKEIKDFYFRKKYLLRIQQRIDTFAPSNQKQ